MRNSLTAVVLSSLLIGAFASYPPAWSQTPESNPAAEKFQEDIKAAVMNGSITIPQVKELKANLEILKAAKAGSEPGAPVDLMTPHTAVSRMKAIMAEVKDPDRETLRQDLGALVASKKAAAPAEPETPGKKLGKDVFVAVMRGTPTDEQVQTLQTSLNSLQSLKSSGGGVMQQLRGLRQAKAQIQQTMEAGSFRPEDRQAVLDDLNNMGPQGGGAMKSR